MKTIWTKTPPKFSWVCIGIVINIIITIIIVNTWKFKVYRWTLRTERPCDINIHVLNLFSHIWSSNSIEPYIIRIISPVHIIIVIKIIVWTAVIVNTVVIQKLNEWFVCIEVMLSMVSLDWDPILSDDKFVKIKWIVGVHVRSHEEDSCCVKTCSKSMVHRVAWVGHIKCREVIKLVSVNSVLEYVNLFKLRMLYSNYQSFDQRLIEGFIVPTSVWKCKSFWPCLDWRMSSKHSHEKLWIVFFTGNYYTVEINVTFKFKSMSVFKAINVKVFIKWVDTKDVINSSCIK